MDFDDSCQVEEDGFVFAWQNKIGQGSKTGNALLIISKKYPLFANQTALPANQSKNPAKNLANQKGECTRFCPVMPNTISYGFLYIERLFAPLLGADRRSFFIS